MKIAIFSFFAGIGFLDLGFETTGYQVKFVNEFMPEFIEGYKHARKSLKIGQPEYGYHDGSATDFLQGKDKQRLAALMQDARKQNYIVGYIAGPPCPDFSVGGKNKGKEGEHGKLSGSYIEMICQQKPDFFLFENVKGLWRTKKHREFYEELKQKAFDNGYIITERLINAIEYGAPQDRQRIILIGFRKKMLDKLQIKTDLHTVIPEKDFPWKRHIEYNAGKIFNMGWVEISPFKIDSALPPPKDVPIELTVEYWFKKNNVANHPNASHHFIPRAGLARFLAVSEGDVSKKSYKRLHRWRYSPTAAYGNNEVHLHPYKARRISVAEALAVQSLPRDFSLPDSMTLSDMFKTVGNGVPYLAARGIALTIKDFFEKKT